MAHCPKCEFESPCIYFKERLYDETLSGVTTETCVECFKKAVAEYKLTRFKCLVD